MANRKRNIQMKFYVTEEEKQLIERSAEEPVQASCTTKHSLRCLREKSHDRPGVPDRYGLCQWAALSQDTLLWGRRRTVL